MMKNSWIIVLLCLCNNAVADIYQCKDKAGRAVFQSSPCGEQDQQTNVISNQKLLSKQNRVGPTNRASSIVGKNLLHNPGFEQQLKNWNTQQDVQWLPTQGLNGSGVVTINARKPPQDRYIHETKINQCVPIQNGSEFTLAGQFHHQGRPVKQNANRLRIYWTTSLDCLSGGQFGGYVEPKDITGWQRLSRQKLIPSLGAKTALIELMQNGRYSNNAKAYWDNINLIPTKVSARVSKTPGYSLPAGFDFIENGDFRRNLKSWRTGWQAQWVGFTGHAYTGAIKITASSTKSSIGKGAFSQCINMGNSSHFNVGASFKRGDTSTQKGGARLRITWYAKDDCRGRAKTDRHQDPTDAKGWQRLQLNNLKSSTGARSVKVEAIQTVAGKGQFVAYWDDVYFKALAN